MFYEVENKGNMIAGIIGYDSRIQHLADWTITRWLYEKEIPPANSRCVDRENLGMKEFRGDESMFGWFVRRTPDAFIYAKAVLEKQGSFLGHI